MRDEQRQAAEHGHVGRDEDMHHARLPSRSVRVDPDEPRMGVRAPVDRDVEHPGDRDVGHVPAAARDEPCILATTHARAE
jgi:hypothetical protein